MYTSSPDFLETLLAWRRQRFSHALFLPVAVTLVVASLVGSDVPTVTELCFRFAGAWLAVFTLRLWDDLEDVERDRENHPERVLTQVTNLRPFVIWVTALLFAVGGLIFSAGESVFGWMVVVAVVAIFYRSNGHLRPDGHFSILMKYPALVLALGGTQLSAAAVVWSAVVMDEVFQQRRIEKSQVLWGTSAQVVAAGWVLLDTNPTASVLAVQVMLVVGMVGLGAQDVFSKTPFPTFSPKVRRVALVTMTLLFLLLCLVDKTHAC